ncbi:PmeII family type II restriction endonuclease [Bacteroides sp. UBA939]|uniref:PmeII family type II restriction endonuclease n=1 Tax=Bacteroides sp. UBA939 TaxID=1946092 RepID=UPI0025B7BB3A|nr:PmeII family type II restriction endonuclease [Bacteroides sp. UBA939]
MEQNISNFHQSRINKLEKLKLKTILKKKNPYLFKAKYFNAASDIVKSLTDAFISSAEETIFGDWLEGLAIFVCGEVYNGWKSTTTGIDLEVDKDSIRYIISIKSGPNWGNSSQISKMRTDFNKAKRTIRTSKSKIEIVAVNGCCYGIDNQPDKGDYFKYCGQEFWYFISGEKRLYTDIIKPLGTKAKERNEEFQENYNKMTNRFTKEFIDEFCTNDGAIDWNKLVQFNSKSKNL